MRNYVIVLNWNGWKDTIACLESLLRLEGPDCCVVVCDNASSDGSFEKIKAWARGEVTAESGGLHLSGFIEPPTAKPIPFLELSREEAESGSGDYETRFVLIQTGANLGFAGGNNVGVRYALGDSEAEFIWLLNNDTIVAPAALSALVAKALTDQRIGAVASICYYANAPSTVQVWAGARVQLWIGFARNSVKPRRDSWFQSLYGASILIARTAFEDVGLLDEGFFLGWEETEFCVRLRKKGWRLAAAPASHVFHKVNASTGGNKLALDRYFTASGLRIIQLHAAAPRLAMVLYLAGRFTLRFLRFEFARCRGVWEGVKDYRRKLPIIPKIH
jgi:GT2 family glycosyltransferase